MSPMTEHNSLIPQVNANFRFVVEVDGERQAAFTECSLPVIQWEVVEVKEGGLNTYTHQLPARRKSARLTLKNGVGKSELLGWYLDQMDEAFQRKDITVTLLNSLREAVMSWHLAGAYPVKWSGPALKSDDVAVAIETLEFACGEIRVERGNA
ncbi:MAG TPA: phage tail protein [Chloroflexi bacterium]|nr:phage tail protein [Chloroflexota bacterium]